LTSHSPIVCHFYSFAIAKATQRHASNPNEPSETNSVIGRVPAARN